MGDLKLSKKCGANPSLCRCQICGKSYGVALLGASYKVDGKEAEAPREVYSGLCPDCEKVINLGGCIFIEVENVIGDKEPKLTGRFIGVTKECKERLKAQHSVMYMGADTFNELFGNHFKNKDHEGSSIE